MAKVVGIAGASGSGKSTLASQLHAHYGCRSHDVIRLDAFYRESEWMHGSFDAQWESPDAIDFEACAAAVRRAAAESEDAYVFVEGFLLFHAPSPLLALFDTRILLEVSSRSALRRRHQRGLDGLDLPTLESVWTQVTWPTLTP
jgi:uridine kinase